MVLQQKIPQAENPFIATYDFADVEEGVGARMYYLFTAKTSAATTYCLTRDSAFYAATIETSTAGSQASATKEADLDFDLATFQIPQIMKGTAYFMGSYYLDGNSASGGSSMYLIVRLRKWDGTTETEIANAQSPTISVAAQDEAAGKTTLPLVISSPVIFAVGNTLRVTVEVWLANSGGSNCISYIAHDPINRDGTKITAAAGLFTSTRIKIPFKIFQ